MSIPPYGFLMGFQFFNVGGQTLQYFVIDRMIVGHQANIYICIDKENENENILKYFKITMRR